MSEEEPTEPCLVLNTRTGKWSIEDRPPIPAAIPPQFEWSSELESAARFYRKHGERVKLTHPQATKSGVKSAA